MTRPSPMLIALLIPLALATLLYSVLLLRAAPERGATPAAEAVALGAITNFFDTLGIGSFAPTMAWLKFRGLVADRLIPAVLVAVFIVKSMSVEWLRWLVIVVVLYAAIVMVRAAVSGRREAEDRRGRAAAAKPAFRR